jgi:hypothetical protein
MLSEGSVDCLNFYGGRLEEILTSMGIIVELYDWETKNEAEAPAGAGANCGFLVADPGNDFF